MAAEEGVREKRRGVEFRESIQGGLRRERLTSPWKRLCFAAKAGRFRIAKKGASHAGILPEVSHQEGHARRAAGDPQERTAGDPGRVPCVRYEDVPHTEALIRHHPVGRSSPAGHATPRPPLC